MTPHRLVPPPEHDAYAVLVSGMVAISGTALLFGGPVPGTVDAAIPRDFITIWAGLLVISGATIVAGDFWLDRLTGMILERAGSVILALACLAYVAAAFAVLGVEGFVFPVLLTFGAGIAAACRVWQITSRLTRIRAILGRRRP